MYPKGDILEWNDTFKAMYINRALSIYSNLNADVTNDFRNNLVLANVDFLIKRRFVNVNDF